MPRHPQHRERIMRAAIAMWGHSPALRLPKRLVEGAGMVVGTEVFLRLEGDSLVVTPTRPKYQLTELLAQMKPEHRQDEVDWGSARGEESW